MSDNQVITFNHYAKPMASKDVIMARSAFTTREKKNILLEEASRRLRNCSPHCTWEEKCVHITTLNLQMLKCGHKQEFRSMITCRAVAKYRNSLKNHESGVKVMYRRRAEMISQWEQEGGKPTKSDWFRKSGATGVFNLHATHGSWLANTVQKVFNTVPGPEKTKILVTERPGRSVKSVLCTANPFPCPSCGRQLCPDTARGQDCRDLCYRESVGYAGRCKRCITAQITAGVPEEDVKHSVYLGESSRSLPSRSSFHFRDYSQEMKKKKTGSKKVRDEESRREEGEGGGRGRRGSEEEEDGEGMPAAISSWMAEHSRECHGGVISADPSQDYEFLVTGTFSKPLHRQVDEMLRINRAESTGVIRIGKGKLKVKLPLLNSKHEYWAPRSMSYNFSNYNR